MKTPQGWLKLKGPGGKYVPAKGLWKDRDGLCYWRKLQVTRYFPRSMMYEGYWEHTNQRTKLPRIKILFDVEDPRKFVKRYKHAFTTRMWADSLIKFSFPLLGALSPLRSLKICSSLLLSWFTSTAMLISESFLGAVYSALSKKFLSFLVSSDSSLL